MSDGRLRTQRLELLPLTADAIEALLAGDGGRLRSLTNAEFPLPVGPPPYMADSLPVVRERLRTSPAEAPWWNWLVVRRDNRQAVGSVAFAGAPDAAGAVLLGYAMYPEREGRGYATEAARVVRDFAFDALSIKRLIALIDPENIASTHVAKKIGMQYEADVMLEGYTHPDHVYAIEAG